MAPSKVGRGFLLAVTGRAPVGALDLDILAADTYQPDNSVQFDENQTSPVHLGLPELAENLKFIIDRAETGSSPI